MRDYAEFLRQFRAEFKTTGAIAPSSRFLARAMTRPFAARTGPARILEVGPGTGAVTRRIVRLLGAEDQLQLVELNQQFAEVLRRRFRRDAHYRRIADRAALHVGPIQDFQADFSFDYIISGLPLNNFSAGAVREIFETLLRLLAPDGVLSYFEYMYVRRVRGLVVGHEERTRLRALDDVTDWYLSKHRIGRNWVFANLPPAWVQHLRRERFRDGSAAPLWQKGATTD